MRIARLSIGLPSNEISSAPLAVKGHMLLGTWPGLTNSTVQNIYPNANALPPFPLNGLASSGELLIGNPQEGGHIKWVGNGLNNGVIDTLSYAMGSTQNALYLQSNGAGGVVVNSTYGLFSIRRMVQINGPSGFTNTLSPVFYTTPTLHTVQTFVANTTIPTQNLLFGRAPHPSVLSTFIGYGTGTAWLNTASNALQWDIKDATGNMVYAQIPLSSSAQFPSAQPVWVTDNFTPGFTLGDAHHTVIYTGGTGTTINLPNPSNALGKRFILMKTDGAGSITVNRNTALINNASANVSINTPYEPWTFIAIRRPPRTILEWVSFKNTAP
jgi:hypothetical protein